MARTTSRSVVLTRQICSVICFAGASAGCALIQNVDSAAGSRPTSAATAQDKHAAADTTQSVAEKPDACPSSEFGKFLRAFSDSAKVQRQFTKFPLEHGQLDLAASDTDQSYKLRTITSFEAIPSFDSHHGGIIIPSETQRAKAKVRLVIQSKGAPEDPEYPEERKLPEDMAAKLYIEDTGFHVYYRFQWLDGCWYLRAIHDKST